MSDTPSAASSAGHVLPDLIRPGLITVFCGSAAGRVSADIGLPYAGPGNKFWPMLHKARFTPHRFAPSEWLKIDALNIGITDINKTQSGADSDLTDSGDDPGGLEAKIIAAAPRQLVFTAKRPAQVFLEHFAGRKKVDTGLQPERLGTTEIFVLPSPSGLAIRWWDEGPWMEAGRRHRIFAEETS